MGLTTPAPSQPLLIVGSDTDVGKTIVTTALLAYWLQYRDPAQIAVMKPLQTGIGDRERYGELFPDLHQAPDTLTPLRFEAPLAPPLAADRESRTIDLAPVWTGSCKP
jgi:dethiobiotin synthetase